MLIVMRLASATACALPEAIFVLTSAVPGAVAATGAVSVWACSGGGAVCGGAIANQASITAKLRPVAKRRFLF